MTNEELQAIEAHYQRPYTDPCAEAQFGKESSLLLCAEVRRLQALFNVADAARDTVVDASSDLMAEIMRYKNLASFLAMKMAVQYNTDPRNSADPEGVSVDDILLWAEEQIADMREYLKNGEDDA